MKKPRLTAGILAALALTAGGTVPARADSVAKPQQTPEQKQRAIAQAAAKRERRKAKRRIEK